MGGLGEIIGDEPERNGSCTVDWAMVINLYFRGNDAKEQVEAWADKNGYYVSFEYSRRSAAGGAIKSVTFRPKAQDVQKGQSK
jgi:hypothetical protein